jgi:hypothetical protein
MKDRYLIIYMDSVYSACMLKKSIINESNLSYIIDRIIQRQGEILTISKCLVSE